MGGLERDGLAGGAPSAVGKIYDGGARPVRAVEYRAYAAATDDPNPAYDGPEGVAPPMFHVRPFNDLLLGMARDPDLALDMLRLVHGEHAMRFHRPLRDGDVLQVTGVLLGLEEKASGRVARFGLRGHVGSSLAIEGSTTYFVRAERRTGGPGAPKKEAVAESPPPDAVCSQPVTLDQATRYAAASGDDNPIHLDATTAKEAGLPGVILHGLCTLALAQRDLVRGWCGGDPTRLASLSVRFARPVFPGDTLSLEVWSDGPTLRFQTKDGAGRIVLANGLAERR